MSTWNTMQMCLPFRYVLVIRIQQLMISDILCFEKTGPMQEQSTLGRRLLYSQDFFDFCLCGDSCRGEGLDSMNVPITNLQKLGVELPNSRTPRKCWLPWWKSHKMTVYCVFKWVKLHLFKSVYGILIVKATPF